MVTDHPEDLGHQEASGFPWKTALPTGPGEGLPAGRGACERAGKRLDRSTCAPGGACEVGRGDFGSCAIKVDHGSLGEVFPAAA